MVPLLLGDFHRGRNTHFSWRGRSVGKSLLASWDLLARKDRCHTRLDQSFVSYKGPTWVRDCYRNVRAFGRGALTYLSRLSSAVTSVLLCKGSHLPTEPGYFYRVAHVGHVWTLPGAGVLCKHSVKQRVKLVALRKRLVQLCAKK